MSAASRDNYTKEMTSFLRLLKNAPIGLEELESLLVQTLEFRAEGFELHLIIDYLALSCTEAPDIAVSLLHEIVSSGRMLYLTTDTRENVEKILLAATHADEASSGQGNRYSQRIW